MQIELTPTAKYKCPKCDCPVFRATDDDGKRIFVHRTCNNYADHAKHCPRRRPDIVADLDAGVVTEKEIKKTIKQFKNYAKPKTTIKKASQKKGNSDKKSRAKSTDHKKGGSGKNVLPKTKRAKAS